MSRRQTLLTAMLMAGAGPAVVFKLLLVHVGAPYVTVDDSPLFEGGFLVWFGQAPPQRLFLESWISGLTSIGTYLATTPGAMGGNLIADAWRAFHADPDPFVHAYRWLMLLVDLAVSVKWRKRLRASSSGILM